MCGAVISVSFLWMTSNGLKEAENGSHVEVIDETCGY